MFSIYINEELNLKLNKNSNKSS